MPTLIPAKGQYSCVVDGIIVSFRADVERRARIFACHRLRGR